MFNGSGEVSVQEADCAASVGQAVKWDRGGSQPAQEGWSGVGGWLEGNGVQYSEKVYRSGQSNWDVCKQETFMKNILHLILSIYK